MPGKPRSAPLRSALKSVANVVALALVAPLWLPARLEATLTGGEGFFTAGAELLSLVPGRIGVYLRRGYYRVCLDACSAKCYIGFGTMLAHPQCRIGQGVYIGTGCSVGRAVIEDHATLGSNVDVLSGRRQHNFRDLDQPIQDQGGTFDTVRIGHNSWIGNSSVIMADIGEDCVIGAGSVVVKPIPPCSIAVGNPAVVKRVREPASNREEGPAA
jgi:acetyltransferase-like isoleucine patch superfamily enzyme